MPERIRIICSGNIIKNVKGVTVPNSGGQKGIEAAAILGAVGGDADKMLEVISNINSKARETTKKLVKAGICEVELAENVPNLYIKAQVWANGHSAAVTIEDHHTSITRIEKDDKELYYDPERRTGCGNGVYGADRYLLRCSKSPSGTGRDAGTHPDHLLGKHHQKRTGSAVHRINIYQGHQEVFLRSEV
jgi:hypothetical protein